MDDERTQFDALADALAAAHPEWAPLAESSRAAIVEHVNTAPTITFDQARLVARLFQGSAMQRERVARDGDGAPQ